MKETLWTNALFSPSIAVPIRVTVRMPMTIPSVVSIDRILLARMAPQEMRRPSLSSVRKVMGQKLPRSKIQDPEKIQAPRSKAPDVGLEFGPWIFSGSWILDLGCFSCATHRRHNRPPHLFPLLRPLIARNQSIPNTNNSAGMSCYVLLMGDHDDRVALTGQFPEQRQDLFSGFGIEIPGWLVRQQN